MKYTLTNIKRVFIVEFEHNDNLMEQLTNLVKKENVKSGIILLLGGLKEAGFVVGPEEISVPPVPVWKNFNDGREILGFGTIYWKGNEVKLHIHAGLGRKDDVNVGCVRKDTKVYLIVECIIFEFETEVVKDFNCKLGIDTIKFEYV